MAKQLLSEAVVMRLIGGAIGILFGGGSSLGISHALLWPISISPLAVMAAVVFSTMGIFFGYYPARKAAQLDPIEALRFE